jgi:hypothetical protein
MDFYSGPAVLLVDGEAYDVMAFIDSAQDQLIQDWGGYLETGPYGDVARFRAFGSEDVWLRIPGVPACDIEVTCTEEDGFAFSGLGRSPLPAFTE